MQQTVMHHVFWHLSIIGSRNFISYGISLPMHISGLYVPMTLLPIHYFLEHLLVNTNHCMLRTSDKTCQFGDALAQWSDHHTSQSGPVQSLEQSWLVFSAFITSTPRTDMLLPATSHLLTHSTFSETSLALLSCWNVHILHFLGQLNSQVPVYHSVFL